MFFQPEQWHFCTILYRMAKMMKLYYDHLRNMGGNRWESDRDYFKEMLFIYVTTKPFANSSHIVNQITFFQHQPIELKHIWFTFVRSFPVLYIEHNISDKYCDKTIFCFQYRTYFTAKSLKYSGLLKNMNYSIILVILSCVMGLSRVNKFNSGIFHILGVAGKPHEFHSIQKNS